MNKDRRKEIAKIVATLSDVKAKIEEIGLVDEINDANTAIEEIRDDEQEYYDNMPEGLQSGDKGSAAEQAIGELDSAKDELDNLVSELEGLADRIDSAITSLGSAIE